MFYSKNLPLIERVIRTISGLGLTLLGMLYLHGASGNLWGLAAVASGLGAAITGFLGFCPACAMVGRKLGKRTPGA
jgi:hypothetical protein